MVHLDELLHPFGDKLHLVVQYILLCVQDAVLECLRKHHLHDIGKYDFGAIRILEILPQPRLNIHVETRAALP